MTYSITPLPSLVRARLSAPGFPMCATWQGINGSTAWKKSVSHTGTMRPTPGSP